MVRAVGQASSPAWIARVRAACRSSGSGLTTGLSRPETPAVQNPQAPPPIVSTERVNR